MEALQKFTDEFEDYFWQDMEKLNIKKSGIVVTQAIDQKYIGKMQDLVRRIVEAGFGYIKEGSVYFDVKKFAQNHKYGNLINLDMEGFKAGVRIDVDEYEKENVQDFVLWKGQKEGEPVWDFELNGEFLPGRPGWHIECSAMGEAELGCPFDIHTGGIDLKFPHHENEIAQSVIGYNCEQPVNYWIHNEFLFVDGVKMSKRYKNFYTLRDLEAKNIEPLAFRFLCMQTNYGKQMNFTWDALESAESGWIHLYNQTQNLGEPNKEVGKWQWRVGDVNKAFKDKFLSSINDDLNTSQALAVMQEVFKSDLSKEEKLATILDFDEVLGLDLSFIRKVSELHDEAIRLKEKRQKARDEKNFAESDRLRDEIEKLGYIVEDTKDGQRIYKK
jgi:cysteinyl-tRNA synthetase